MNKELRKEFQRTEKGLGAGQNDYRYLAWLETRAISQAARIAELKAALRGAGIFILSAKKVGFEDADEANEVIDKQLKKINAALETTAKAETEKV